jgi:hypothetical protein
MRIIGIAIVASILLVAAAPAVCLDGRAYEFREDFGMEPLSDCGLNYYYYIPCPTYSWFWSIYGFEIGDIVGSWFRVGDISMFGYDPCDPEECQTLEMFRVLELSGYGIP